MCTHILMFHSEPSGVNMTHLSLLLLLSLRPDVWQSTSSRLACWEIKQMLETNWKTNSPGRRYISQASSSRSALSDWIIPALKASWSSVKLIQHPGYQSVQHNPPLWMQRRLEPSGASELWEKSLQVVMIRTARTALIFSVNHKHAVLTSQRSHQCLDTLRTAEKPTMCDMDGAFFFWHMYVLRPRGKKRLLGLHQRWVPGETAQCFGHTISAQLAWTPPPLRREICVRGAFYDTVFLWEIYSEVVW